MRKKKHKKYGHKHGSFCVWRPNIKFFFDLIELNIKMSSVSNVSEDNSRSEEFSLKNIEELVDSEGQNWFKKAYVRKFLGLRYTDTSVGSLDKCEMLSSALPPPPLPLMARGFGLDLRIIKTRRTNSSRSLGSCMSL